MKMLARWRMPFMNSDAPIGIAKRMSPRWPGARMASRSRPRPSTALVPARDACAHAHFAQVGARAVDAVSGLAEEARYEHTVQRHEPLPEHGEDLRDPAARRVRRVLGPAGNRASERSAGGARARRADR